MQQEQRSYSGWYFTTPVFDAYCANPSQYYEVKNKTLRSYELKSPEPSRIFAYKQISFVFCCDFVVIIQPILKRIYL
jgi:hypothetical protein